MERGGPQQKKFCLSTFPHGKFLRFRLIFRGTGRENIKQYFLLQNLNMDMNLKIPHLKTEIQISKSKHNLDLNDEFHD